MKIVHYALAVLVIALAAAGSVALICIEREFGTDKLVILSPNPESVKIEFKQAFIRYYQEQTKEAVDIEWLNTGGGTQDQLQYIRTQFEKNPEGIGVDVFWGGGADPYMDLKSHRLLQPFVLPRKIIQAIPPVCAGMPVYDPEQEWYGTALSGFGIIYNRELVRKMRLPEPKTWEDLASPKLYNLVACGDPRLSGVAHMMIEIILQAYGWEKGFDIITRMCANIRSFSDSSALVPASVGLGEALYGLAIDFYAWSEIQKDGPERVGFVMPEGLTVVTPDGIAILRGAPHLKLARAFVEFVLSEDGQLLWVMPAGEPGGPTRYPLNRISVLPSVHKRCGAKCTVPLTPSDFKAQMNYDTKKGSIRWSVLNDLLGALMIDTHSELTEAWQAVIAKKMPPEAVRKLCSVPVTEMEAMTLAEAKWKESAFRNKKIAEWIDFARKRYRELAR
jgi:ABC-type Fe3+ transport system substrate-binding protein